MEIKILPLGPIQTNAFLWIQGSEAVLVDAPEGSFATVGTMLESNSIQLKALLLTHGHWDHTVDAPAWIKEKVPTYGHKGDQNLFEDPDCMRDYMPPGTHIDPIHIDHWVEDGDQLNLLNQKVEVRHVPGHAPGNILFYLPDHAACFSGDALFSGSIGRFDLPGGDFEQLLHSIRYRMYTLPEETEVYPGHGPTTQIRREMLNNPFTCGN